MKKNALVSVIVPVYNAQAYLNNCIESISRQTFSDFECVLVNDGSTDESLSVCRSWEQKDSRFHVITTPNQGAAAARNRGIKESYGEWVAFIDCDDAIAEGYLEYLYHLTKKYGADLAVCSYAKIYHNRILEETKQPVEESWCYTGLEATKRLLYQQSFLSVPWGMLSQRKLWDHVAFPEGTKAEDMGTIYRLFLATTKVAYGNRAYYYYYQRPGNTMFSTQSVRNIDYYQHSKTMVHEIEKKVPVLRLAAINRHFAACFQILSECEVRERGGELGQKIYRDIRQYRKLVLVDKRAKIRNRGAAALSMISIREIHWILHFRYVRQMKRL
ncbi:MAG TPA: glycosyltransferase family 2 protein [Lachnospiraceae bacterium]|nr:glycosyltransferase family 2 protein [Lachnospiraceae bacterium]HPF28588.1 glycosyltransferase family 2 protein [Lachnospiraceae bacterium]